MLKHIALTVNSEDEIKDFYTDLLDFRLTKQFSLDETFGQNIFNLSGQASVYYMTHSDLDLEIFLGPHKEKKAYAHICLAYREAEMICQRAADQGYRTYTKKNPGKDTYFIWDKSGNLFEVKHTE